MKNLVMKIALLAAAGPGGATGQCTAYNGRPVPYIPNYQLHQAAMATVINGMPVILLNPNQVSVLSPIMVIFLKAHECMHHAMPIQDEVAADLGAAATLVRYGVLTRANISELLADVRKFAISDATHPDGNTRASLIYQAAVNAGLQ